MAGGLLLGLEVRLHEVHQHQDELGRRVDLDDLRASLLLNGRAYTHVLLERARADSRELELHRLGGVIVV